MFLLKHTKPEEATGKVADAYAVFPKEIPVPDPLLLMSVSPELTEIQSGIIRHYMTHEKLDMGLLAMIRYLVASDQDYKFCVNMNTGLLKMAGGMTDEELKALRENPENAPLEEFQKALLLFVLKVVKTPEDVTENDVESLRQLGWSDKDIFEAAFHGTSMIGAGKLYKAFVK
jgi:hypothetical protein